MVPVTVYQHFLDSSGLFYAVGEDLVEYVVNQCVPACLGSIPPKCHIVNTLLLHKLPTLHLVIDYHFADSGEHL